MENIIDSHHDIAFFLVVVITFVLYMLLRIYFFFNNQNTKTIRSLYLTHNTFIEIVTYRSLCI